MFSLFPLVWPLINIGRIRLFPGRLVCYLAHSVVRRVEQGESIVRKVEYVWITV